jgi:alkanesulfonate monooxygenase SsuD/methylene tetrahydromethanopterin reductase-like flavin-dependent oxidoreductase (luciferase family)
VKVFVFDLLAYDANLDHLKNGEPELPYPLAKRYFDADTAMRTYEEHLDAWEALDRFGYDGVGFNEHHCSPYGLMNSPNLMAAAAAQRTKNLKLLIYGNLLAGASAAAPRRGAGDDRLPVERAADLRLRARHPARIPGAQRAARAVARPLRGSLRHHHPRLDRGGVLLRRAILVVQGCRAMAAPGAAAASADLDPGGRQPGIDRIRREAQLPDHPWSRPCPRAARRHHPLLREMPRARPGIASRRTICRSASPPTSPTQRRRRLREYGPHILYFNRTLFSHGNFTETETQRQTGYSSQASTDYVRPENLRAAANLRSEFRNLTMEQLAEQAEHMPMGTADEVIERIIDAAESAGANTVQLAMNRGALPHDLFMAQIERFAREVLPALQAHEVKTVPAAEEAMA